MIPANEKMILSVKVENGKLVILLNRKDESQWPSGWGGDASADPATMREWSVRFENIAEQMRRAAEMMGD
jgi:hypothetical protein